MKGLKIKQPTFPKLRIRRQGERTLTSGDKRKEKEKFKGRCQRCKKKFPLNLLSVHHKKEISKYKSKGPIDIPYLEFYNKRKKKAHYDKSKNLMVLCPTCHKEVHNEESAKRKAKKKIKVRRSKNILEPTIRTPY